jgi:hypothetical protein
MIGIELFLTVGTYAESCVHIVTCFLLTCQIICGLRVLYLNLLVIHQAELQLHTTLPILYHINQ